VNVSGNPVLPKSEQTFERHFRSEVFSMLEIGTLGNSSRKYTRGPGIENWDLSLIKAFPYQGTGPPAVPSRSLQRLQPHTIQRRRYRGALRQQPQQPHVSAAGE
jgi:hypothetical protein